MEELNFLNKIEKDIENNIKLIVNQIDGEKLLLYILMKQELMFSNSQIQLVESSEDNLSTRILAISLR